MTANADTAKGEWIVPNSDWESIDNMNDEQKAEPDKAADEVIAEKKQELGENDGGDSGDRPPSKVAKGNSKTWDYGTTNGWRNGMIGMIRTSREKSPFGKLANGRQPISPAETTRTTTTTKTVAVIADKI